MPKLSVSIDSVHCRLEIKEVYRAAEAFPGESNGLLMGLKANFDLQNLVREKNGEQPIPLGDWGLMILHAGFAAIACSEEDAQDAAAN